MTATNSRFVFNFKKKDKVPLNGVCPLFFITNNQDQRPKPCFGTNCTLESF